MKKEEVIERMQKPWGIMQLIKGKWPDYRLVRIQGENEDRLDTALWFVLLLEQANDKKPAEIRKIIQRLIIEIKKENDKLGLQGQKRIEVGSGEETRSDTATIEGCKIM